MKSKRYFIILLYGCGIVVFLAVGFFFQCRLEDRERSWLQDRQVHRQADELAKELESRELLVPADEVPGFASEAVVMLAYLGRHEQGVIVEAPKTAFAIGDGTLILTAAHCVASFQDSHTEAVSPNIVVISPYYGDVFEFEIVAVDQEADLAVLRAHWPSHPALALADEQELKEAQEILTAGYPVTVKEPSLRFARQVRMEKLPILTTSGKRSDSAIVLKGTRFVKGGWSGSALVLPQTGKVVGVLSRLYENYDKDEDSLLIRRNAAGCSVLSINTLLKRHGLTWPAQQKPPELEPVENAQRAFCVAVDYIEAHLNKDLPKLLPLAEELVSLRGESAQAHLFVALSAQAAHTKDSSRKDLLTMAESNFKEALRLAPDKAHGHIMYGNFLMVHKRYEQALTETESALAIDPNNELAMVSKIIILSEIDLNKAEKVGRELTEKHPTNAHCLFYYSRVLTALGRHEEALEAALKAVDLNPKGLYRGELATAFVHMGRFDEAEVCYERMTHECGCQGCWFHYARFLIEHRQTKLDEAEKAIDTAESKTHERVSQKNLTNLRYNLIQAKFRYLEEKESPEKAQAFARQLLAESPENGQYWFELAGILRTQGRYEEAVEAAQQAVRFSPDHPYRPRLANVLGKARRLKEAELVYDEMLGDHPDRPKYWFWYAEFLNEYYPEKTEEARKALTKAQTSGTDWSVAPEELQELREKIDSRAAISQ